MHLWQAHWDKWFYGLSEVPAVGYHNTSDVISQGFRGQVKEDYPHLSKWGLAVPGGLV